MPRLNIGHRKILICLLLVSGTLLAYWQVGRHEFINLDDGVYVYENLHVISGLTLENIIWAFTESHSANWHPVTWVSHMLDIEWYGLDSGGHHWTNLQLHLANGVLLFLVFHLMTGALWPSAFVASLFLLHPLHVESVAWVAERKDVLSTLFWLLSMWAYGRYVQNNAKGYYVLLLFFFVLGLMSKPMVVTLPFVLLLMDYWPLNRCEDLSPYPDIYPVDILPGWGRCILEKVPLFILSAASCIITYTVQEAAGTVLSREAIPFSARFGNAVVAYLEYMMKTVWPSDLAVFYPRPEFIPFWLILLSCMILSGLSVLFLYYRRRFSFLIVGWLWFLGTLVPVIGLVQVGSQKMADRYTYIPLIGLFVMLAWSISALTASSHQRRILNGIITVTLLVPLVVCTWLRVGIWKDSISLFTHALGVTRGNFMAHYALGQPLTRQGNVDGAIDHYLQALLIRPGFKEAHNGLGIALTRKGDLAGAIQHHMTALQIDPSFAEPHYNLARIYDRQDKETQAVLHYEKALQIKPGMKIVLYNLAWLLATDPDGSIRNGERAVQLAERLCAATRFREALALDALAAAYAEIGRFDRAVTAVEKGIELASRFGPPELLTGMQQRSALYRAETPFRRPGEPPSPIQPSSPLTAIATSAVSAGE